MFRSASVSPPRRVPEVSFRHHHSLHTPPIIPSARHSIATLDDHTRSRHFRSQHFQHLWDQLPCGDVSARPQHAYTELIKFCMLKRPDGKLTLNQLYRDLEDKFPFFASSTNGKGWKNTLRHNLSTQPYFIKLEREHGQSGKGHYWTYCPDLEKPSSLSQSSMIQRSASMWPSWPTRPFVPGHPLEADEYWSSRFRATPLPAPTNTVLPSSAYNFPSRPSPTASQHLENDFGPDHFRDRPMQIARESETGFRSEQEQEHHRRHSAPEQRRGWVRPSEQKCFQEMPLPHRPSAFLRQLDRDDEQQHLRRYSSPENVRRRDHRLDLPPISDLAEEQRSEGSLHVEVSSGLTSPHSASAPISPLVSSTRARSKTTSGLDLGPHRNSAKLHGLPKVRPRKSLGDYWLSHPISVSSSSASSARRSQSGSPY